MTTISILLVMLIGLGGGLAVGSGFVAFITVFGILPRLAQLTKTHAFILVYEWAIVAGALAGAWFSLDDIFFTFSEYVLIPLGFAAGMFIGMIAAALTEVLNVLPILAKRIGVGEEILRILTAIVLGKIFGSLFHWIFFINL